MAGGCNWVAQAASMLAATSPPTSAGAGDAAMPRSVLLRELETLRRQNQELRLQNSQTEAVLRENEKLRARIAELEDALARTQKQLTAITDATYRERSESSSFAVFMESNPDIKARWQAFLQRSLLTAPDPRQLLDPDWPLPSR